MVSFRNKVRATLISPLFCEAIKMAQIDPDNFP